MATAIIGLIGAIIAGGVSLYSSSQQQGVLSEGAKESKTLSEKALARQSASDSYSQALQNKQFKENQRQFNVSMNYKKQQDQFEKLNGFLDQDQNLKNLFVNRLAGLRR